MQVRSPEEWHKLVLEHQKSQEPVAEFCKRHQIHESSFYYWRSKQKIEKSESIKMLPVVTPEIKPVDLVELYINKGMSLRFSAGASPRYVADIIKALV